MYPTTGKKIQFPLIKPFDTTRYYALPYTRILIARLTGPGYTTATPSPISPSASLAAK
jgi:hypothetical protein